MPTVIQRVKKPTMDGFAHPLIVKKFKDMIAICKSRVLIHHDVPRMIGHPKTATMGSWHRRNMRSRNY